MVVRMAPVPHSPLPLDTGNDPAILADRGPSSRRVAQGRWGTMPPGGSDAHLPRPEHPWQMLCLVEITNFAQLRRYLGCSRADGLVHDLSVRLAAEIGVTDATRAGRATLEFACRARSFDDLRAILDRVAEGCRTAFDIEGEAHQFVVSIGAAATACPNTDAIRLAEEAEAALSDSLLTAGIALRDVSVGTRGLDRLALVRDLPQAIATGEMFLQYQPKIHLRRQEISSAEALVRWQHPDRGLILPGDFITIAEDSGHILALTLWTLEQVITDQVALASDGQDLTIFLNISGQLLGDTAFVETACRRVRESGAKIGFEITETAVIRHPDVAISNLQALADVGISIAIDDYGAGLSSLAYLKKLPAQEIGRAHV